MNGSQLRAALRGGQRVYGTLIISTSPQWPAAVRATGVDFVFIDTEHITIDRTTLAWMCQTYRALGLAPVVRIPEPDPYQATVALDDGACGVLAPYVETPGQAKRLRGAVKLRPLKGRLLEGVLNGERQLASPLAEYVDERCSNNVLMINIDSVPAIEALDEILSVRELTPCRSGRTTCRAASACRSSMKTLALRGRSRRSSRNRGRTASASECISGTASSMRSAGSDRARI